MWGRGKRRLNFVKELGKAVEDIIGFASRLYDRFARSIYSLHCLPGKDTEAGLARLTVFPWRKSMSEITVLVVAS